MVVIGLVAAGIATGVAIFVPWLPPPSSREAGRIWFVYWFATVISLAIFAVVAAVLVYALINFRAKDDDLSDGPPVHGHTTLEIFWTAVPTVLVTSIAIVSAIVLAKNGNAGTDPLKIKVVGQQFAWQFTYPNGKTFTSLYLPKDRHVKLEITSYDVIHSFWVPEFSQKQDAVPGETNPLVITPDRLGTYPVICTELCGLGHALMRSQAIVMTPAAYDKWYRSGGGEGGAKGGGAQGGGAQGGQGGSAAAAVATFTKNGCVACHTFSAIPGATGKVGPDLDHLKSAAAKAGQPLAAFIKQSIVNPDAYIAPGYHAGVMPPNFGSQIPGPQIDQLVQYLAEHTKS
jgi:cytochrome c oxidase subunit 2